MKVGRGLVLAFGMVLVTASTAGPTEAVVAKTAILIGAGDIARCTSLADEKTAALIARIPGTVFTAGDNAYDDGSAANFACYNRSWGRVKARTRPVVGNHDYETRGASAYFDYFGAAAGPRGKGWYSYNVGAWHVVALNSNCDEVGGCEAGSPQERWLRADLAANHARCTLAIWHHPRWSSSKHGNMARSDAFWRDLYADGAELVIVGHGHEYERFAPLNPSGTVDRPRGIREFMVGTGGAELKPFAAIAPHSEVRNATTFGVLMLALRPTGYTWRFLPAGGTFTDSGSGVCH